MLCPTCGKEIDDEAFSCYNCGTIVQSSLQPRASVTNEDSISSPENQNQPSAPLKRSSRKKWVYVALLVIVSIVISGLGIYLNPANAPANVHISAVNLDNRVQSNVIVNNAVASSVSTDIVQNLTVNRTIPEGGNYQFFLYNPFSVHSSCLSEDFVINSISVQSGGFTLSSMNATLPLKLTPPSNETIVMLFSAPSHSYNGPIGLLLVATYNCTR